MAYVVMKEGLKVPPAGAAATVGATITDAQAAAFLQLDTHLSAGDLVYVPDAEVAQFNTDRGNKVLAHDRLLPGPGNVRYKGRRAEDYNAGRRGSP